MTSNCLSRDSIVTARNRKTITGHENGYVLSLLLDKAELLYYLVNNIDRNTPFCFCFRKRKLVNRKS
jgi:hypothetical protein